MRTAGMNVTLIQYFFIGRGTDCIVALRLEIPTAQFSFHGLPSFNTKIIIETEAVKKGEIKEGRP